MSRLEAGKPKLPHDLVAIFHVSFHPTKGSLIDWSLKASEDFDLTDVEFSCLPSGLHLVEQDVVYFTKSTHQGLCIFRRRPTTDHGHRGFRLSSIGILLAKSTRPRPWRHLAGLKELVGRIYGGLAERGGVEMEESDWDMAKAWFEERKVGRGDLGGAGRWDGWSHEFDLPDYEPASLEPSSSAPRAPSPSTHPTLHLPHLLRILGPSTLTLYKHVLARRRILIFTLPPVEAACILCHIAADMCFEDQVDYDSPAVNVNIGGDGDGSGWLGNGSDDGEDLRVGGLDSGRSRQRRKLKGKCKEGIQVLGMVTLNDLDRLQKEGQSGRGFIACTTDAIFLEKPSYYDLLIDLTSSTPSKASRPTLYTTKVVPPTTSGSGGSRRETWKLSRVGFGWSDVKLWTELDRILQIDANERANDPSLPHSHHHCCDPSSYLRNHAASSSDPSSSSSFSTTGTGASSKPPSSSWTDVWRLYEDVCLICAGLWMGGWRGNSTASYSSVNREGEWAVGNWGAVRLEGDDDLSLGTVAGENSRGSYVRNVGMGIEGRPSGSGVASVGIGNGNGARKSKSSRRSSGGMSWSSLTGKDRDRRQQQSSQWQAEEESTSSTPPVRLTAQDPKKVEAKDDSEFEVIQAIKDKSRDRDVLTTLALLQTFHAHTSFLLSRLESYLPPVDSERLSTASTSTTTTGPSTPKISNAIISTSPAPKDPPLPTASPKILTPVTLTPKDIVTFELGPLNSMDAKFIEWLAEEYGGGVGVVVRRGWRDLLGLVFGFG
ncbi:hypothetical protein JAAARDRAFT_193588 [Jaapia argillacea MUCL 33604]|uniref:UDENN domain-containing protein n=1 Tax=Jaapia argillacea MUCL 33604 TaxID=933084 RepID=A0A067PTT0_9AGAM|nr:hypothetical protein JAAARDRAFT_193588 [Jaapia argillacea MUCL 33604]